MDANFADQHPNVENFENQADYYRALINYYRQMFIRAGVVDQNGVRLQNPNRVQNRVQNQVNPNDIDDFEIMDLD